MQSWNLKPAEIESRSFAIIDEEAGEHGWPTDAWSIVRRMIHTSADFDYVKAVRMHPTAVQSGKRAISSGCCIFTDTRMALSGISARRLEPFGSRVECYITHPEVAAKAKADGVTRSAAAVDLALELLRPEVFAIGNAPTALFRLIEHIEAGRAKPALVVGLPVGFVNAVESKDALSRLDIPFITALGRKGGSNLAAGVINALAVLCLEEAGHAAQ